MENVNALPHEKLGISKEEMLRVTNNNIETIKENLKTLKWSLLLDLVIFLVNFSIISFNFIYVPFRAYKVSISESLIVLLVNLVIMETIYFVATMIMKKEYKTFIYTILRDLTVSSISLFKGIPLFIEGKSIIRELKTNGYYKELVESVSKDSK